MNVTLTQNKLIDAFATSLIESERSAATVEKYIRDLRAYFLHSDNTITKEKLLSYKEHLRKSYATASANSMLAAINAFLRFIDKTELCLKRFKVQRSAFRPEDKELTREEYARIVRAAKSSGNERLNLIIQTICSTGIRVSELKFITKEAVYRGEATINCKGKIRRIFIVKELRQKLISYTKERKIESGSVFITKRGNPISRSCIWRQMKSLCRSANVASSKVFPHNLRHLFAKTFYSLEKDIAKLADILGHTSIDTTRIYVMTSPAEHRRKMEKMRLII